MTEDADSTGAGEPIDRRRALTSIGAVGLAAAVFGSRALAALTEDAHAATTCLLTPEVTEGPYWIDNTLTRRNITEGKPGLPLQIVFTVVDARTCRPIRAADVEIWHCDTVGAYSGYDRGSPGFGTGPGGHAEPTSTTRYLRGHQRSDASGRAEFLTVFPGWYQGRTPHIHMKVHAGGNTVHTGQVFFDERITAAVYRTPLYRSRGQADTPHARDSIYAEAGGARATLKLMRRPKGQRGYVGRIVVGVATTV